MPPPGKQQLHGLAALAAKLTSHWTPISFKLYLRHEVPFPLPAVGPLAECAASGCGTAAHACT